MSLPQPEILTPESRMAALAGLGEYLKQRDERLRAHLIRAGRRNPWFTPENLEAALDAACAELLDRKRLSEKIASLAVAEKPSRIAIINQEATPLAALWDVVPVFLAGHASHVKLPEEDPFLLPFFAKYMAENNPALADYFHFPDRLPLRDCSASIATGLSGNLNYYKKYLGKKPHLLRPQKRAVAILDGGERPEDFRALAKDVFTYFGKGSRNVSKLLVPENYDFNPLLEVFHEQRDIIRNDCYKNAFDYQLSLLILDRVLHWNNGAIILARNPSLFSPTAVLHFEHYRDAEQLREILQRDAAQIQHVVKASEHSPAFGESLKHRDWGFPF